MDATDHLAPSTPFQSRQSQASFFMGLPQEEAWSRLEFAQSERLGVVALLAGEGHGKSFLLYHFRRHLARRGVATALVSLQEASPDDVLRQLSEQLRVSPMENGAGRPLWSKLERHLEGLSLVQAPVFLAFDDVHLIQPETANLLPRLMRVMEQFGLGTVVLSSSASSSKAGGGKSSWRIPVQSLRVDLPRWSEADCARYVRQMLQSHAGQPLAFAPNALETLHEITLGIPGRLVNACRLAYLAAMAEDRSLIGRETILAVSQELTGDFSEEFSMMAAT